MSQRTTSNTVNRFRRSGNGFTLLEILIALAIVSILTMIAVPFYQDYRTRVKVAGELPLAEPVKKIILEIYMIDGFWATSNSEAKVNAADVYKGDYLQSVMIGNTPTAGALTLTFDSAKLPALGANNTLVFYPNETAGGGSISWHCDLGTMNNRYRPKNCRLP